MIVGSRNPSQRQQRVRVDPDLIQFEARPPSENMHIPGPSRTADCAQINAFPDGRCWSEPIVPVIILPTLRKSSREVTLATIGSGWMLLLPLLVALTPSEASESPSAVATAPAACTLTLGWEPRAPYYFEDADGGVRGLDFERVKAIAEGASCTLELESGQGSELLEGLKRGSIDILAGSTANTERGAFAHFSVPYREDSFKLYIRTGESEFLAGNTFFEVLENGPHVGVVKGYYYGNDVSAEQFGGEFEQFFAPAVDAHANLRALVEMGVDVALEDPQVASALLSRHGWQDRVELHPLDLGSNPVSLMFSRASVDDALVQRFNQNIEKLKGTWNESGGE